MKPKPETNDGRPETDAKPSIDTKIPKVWNKRKRGVPADAVYVGRPTKWGNPFEMRGEAERPEVVAKHRAWFMRQPELMAQARRELRGKDLVCWCAPKKCHADVLLEVANS